MQDQGQAVGLLEGVQEDNATFASGGHHHVLCGMVCGVGVLEVGVCKERNLQAS